MNLAKARKRKNEPKITRVHLASHKGAINRLQNSSCSSTYCAYEYFRVWLMNVRSAQFVKFKGVCVVSRAWERTCNCLYESLTVVVMGGLV